VHQTDRTCFKAGVGKLQIQLRRPFSNAHRIQFNDILRAVRLYKIGFRVDSVGQVRYNNYENEINCEAKRANVSQRYQTKTGEFYKFICSYLVLTLLCNVYG